MDEKIHEGVKDQFQRLKRYTEAIRDEVDSGDVTCIDAAVAAIELADAEMEEARSEAGRYRAKVEAAMAAIGKAASITPEGSTEWRESGIAMRTTVLWEIREAIEAAG